MPTGLYKRQDGRSQNWYVRIVAPVEIHPLLEPSEREIRQSTGTPDRGKAQAIKARIEATHRQKWESLRACVRQPSQETVESTQLSESLISQICGARQQSWIFTDDFERVEHGLDDEAFEEIEAFCKISDGTMRGILAKGKNSSDWPHVVSQVLDWCQDLGYQIDPTDALFPQLVRRFAATEKKSSEVIALRNAGEDASFPEQQAPKHLLSDMAPVYEKVLQSGGRKTMTTNLSIWKRLTDFCKNKALDEVTTRDIYAFLDERLHAEVDRWGWEYTNKAKNILQTVFGLARTQNLMTASNPVRELETMPKITAAENKKRKKPRLPYNLNQLNILFASEWYNPDAKRWRGKMKYDLGARYWVPLICLYHGLRVREALQLHSHDILLEDGLPLLSIQVDLDDSESSQRMERHVKNEATQRTVPVHPQLLALGFLDFVKEISTRHRVGAPLFPSSIPDEDSEFPEWGRAYEQRFVPFVRDELAFGSGYGNHSFRHTIEDAIRNLQLIHGVWPAGLSQYYTGRILPRDADKHIVRQQGSEIDYGKGFLAKHALKYISLIQYEGIQLPPPFKKWLGTHDAVHPSLLKEIQRTKL